MTVKQEIREERDDVFSFWENSIQKDFEDNEFTIETKVDETTVVLLTELKDKLTLELDIINNKLNLIEKYGN